MTASLSRPESTVAGHSPPRQVRRSDELMGDEIRILFFCQFEIVSGGSSSAGFAAPAEVDAVHPHAVENHRQTTCDGDDGASNDRRWATFISQALSHGQCRLWVSRTCAASYNIVRSIMSLSLEMPPS